MGRGIDVTGISHIINYDVPQDSDDYVHRVGRTGRMGREGIAFTFVSPGEGGELTKIEKRIDRLLKEDQIEGFATASEKETKPDGPASNDEGPVQKMGRGGRPPKRYRRGL